MTSDLDGRIAMTANRIAGDAAREARRWQFYQDRDFSYCPPLLAQDLDMHKINVAAEQERRRGAKERR